MAKKEQKAVEARPRAKMLTAVEVVEMVKAWSTSTPDQLAERFGVSRATIRTLASGLRKQDASLCPKRRPKRDDVIMAALELLKQQQ